MENEEMLDAFDEEATTEIGDDWGDVDLSDVLSSSEEVETDEPKEETKEEEPKEEEEKEEEKEQPIPEFDFEITYNGTKQKLTKEEAISLAQKGMDYDRIRSDHDFLKEFADKAGQSVEEYKASLIEKARDFGIQQLMEEENISEKVATELYDSRESAIKNLARENEQKQAEEKQAKITAELQRLKNFKPDIDISKIPNEIWDKVHNEGMSLIEAIMLDEVSSLRTENSVLKTNAKNKEQEVTTGTASEQKVKDIYEQAWDDAD